jgi:hypothetical protein
VERLVFNSLTGILIDSYKDKEGFDLVSESVNYAEQNNFKYDEMVFYVRKKYVNYLLRGKNEFCKYA